MPTRVLWVHNYNTNANPLSGIFMRRQLEWLRNCNIRIDTLYLPTRNPVRLVKALMRLRRIRTEYSIVHAQTGSLTGLLASLLTNYPIVWLRGSDWYRVRSGGLKIRIHSSFAVWFTRRALNRVNSVVCTSNRMRKEVSEQYPQLTTEVIPSGVDLNTFYPQDRRECRRALGQEDDDSIWVLFSSVSSNNPVKRVNLAVGAFEYAKSELENVKLIELTDVHPKDVCKYINGSNVILLTSLHEGWPNIVKEGLACCIPFVSTDVSDLSDAAARLPQCYVVDAHPENLGRAIIASISSDPSSLLREYAQRFDSALTTNQLLRLYRDSEGHNFA